MTDVAIAVGVVLVVLALIVGLPWVLAHNRFVLQRQHINESWRDVDVELRRRHDLVPNLVSVVTAYAAHERNLIDLLNQERGLLGGPVAVVAERYPDLRASANFLDLQHQLAVTEDRLAAARRVYNSNVQGHNQRAQSIPTSLVARLGGFVPVAYFEPDQA